MGRKANLRNAQAVVETIHRYNGKCRTADVARKTGLHPQAISRLLPIIEEATGTLLYEDKKGRLGIFKRK
jgi:predicted transcriptional regulator